MRCAGSAARSSCTATPSTRRWRTPASWRPSAALTFVPPYDDPQVIAGQGTVGMEILRQHPDPIEAIFLPVGGGGLAAGVASFTKYLRPDIKVIGVEPDDAPSMAEAIRTGVRVDLGQVGLSPTVSRCARSARRTSASAVNCWTK